MIITSATRAELISLAEQLMSATDESEEARLYQEFKSHFSHPDVANLLYWPEKYDFRTDTPKISDYSLTAAELVDIGIAHKPIQL